jgi:hypothetical protein
MNKKKGKGGTVRRRLMGMGRSMRSKKGKRNRTEVRGGRQCRKIKISTRGRIRLIYNACVISILVFYVATIPEITVISDSLGYHAVWNT